MQSSNPNNPRDKESEQPESVLNIIRKDLRGSASERV